jgi:hypothetical protein
MIPAAHITFFDAMTGVPALLWYSDIIAIEWLPADYKPNIERARISGKNGSTMILFVSLNDGRDIRKWMTDNGAASIKVGGEVLDVPVFLAQQNGSKIKFIEKRGSGRDRRKSNTEFVGKDRRKADRRTRGAK